jgi:hypothetical protein
MSTFNYVPVTTTSWPGNWGPNNFIIPENAQEDYHGPAGACYSGNSLTFGIPGAVLESMGAIIGDAYSFTISYTVHSENQGHTMDLYVADTLIGPMDRDIGSHTMVASGTIPNFSVGAAAIFTTWTGGIPGWLVFTVNSAVLSAGLLPPCQLSIDIV